MKSATVIALLTLACLMTGLGLQNREKAQEVCAGWGMDATAVAALPPSLIPADATVCRR